MEYQRLKEILVGDALGAHTSSALQVLSNAAKRLRESANDMHQRDTTNRVAVEAASVALQASRTQLVALTAQAKELRLGGGCRHGADKGPNCDRCNDEAGKLQGPYASCANGLDVANYWFRLLGAVSEKKAGELEPLLDTATECLEISEAALKQADEALRAFKTRIKRLCKIFKIPSSSCSGTAAIPSSRGATFRSNNDMKGASSQDCQMMAIGQVKRAFGMDPHAVRSLTCTHRTKNDVINIDSDSDDCMATTAPAESSHNTSGIFTDNNNKSKQQPRATTVHCVTDDVLLTFRCVDKPAALASFSTSNTFPTAHVPTVHKLRLLIEVLVLQYTGRTIRVDSLYHRLSPSQKLDISTKNSPRLLSLWDDINNNNNNNNDNVKSDCNAPDESFVLDLEATWSSCVNTEPLSDIYEQVCAHIFVFEWATALDMPLTITPHTGITNALTRMELEHATTRNTNCTCLKEQHEPQRQASMLCVDVSYMGLQAPALASLLATLRYRSDIHVLDLSANSLWHQRHQHVIRLLESTLPTLKNLCQLSLANTPTSGKQDMSSRLLRALPAGCPLRKLDLSGLLLVDTTRHPMLSHLPASVQAAQHEHSQTTTEEKQSECAVMCDETVKRAEAFASMLSRCTTLEALGLARTFNASHSDLQRSQPPAQSATIIGIADSEDTDMCVDTGGNICKQVSNAVTKSIEIISKAIRIASTGQYEQLNELVWSFNVLPSTETMATMAGALLGGGLRIIDCSGSFSGDHCQDISNIQTPPRQIFPLHTLTLRPGGKITELSLANCQIGGKGAQILAQAIESGGSLLSLHKLDLTSCGLDSPGTLSLLHSLVNQRIALNYLNLRHNPDTGVGGDTDAMVQLATLISKRVSWHLNLVDAGVDWTGLVKLAGFIKSPSIGLVGALDAVDGHAIACTLTVGVFEGNLPRNFHNDMNELIESVRAKSVRLQVLLAPVPRVCEVWMTGAAVYEEYAARQAWLLAAKSHSLRGVAVGADRFLIQHITAVA